MSLWINPGYEVVPGLLFWHRLGQAGWHSCGLEPLQNSRKPNAWSSVTQIPNRSFPIPCSKLSYGVVVLVGRSSVPIHFQGS